MKKAACSLPLVLGLFLGVALYFAGTPTLSAQPSSLPTISLRAQGLAEAITHTPDAAAFHLAPDGKSWELNTPAIYHLPGAGELTLQELVIDPDPLIYNNILVLNNSGVAQTYTFLVTLPTGAYPAPNSIRGSIDTSVIGTDTLLSAPLGGAVYTALIDGSSVQTLQNSPFSLGTSQSATTAPAQFGWQAGVVPVNSSIGIQLTFTLSPGDTAAILSDFEVVPEPATLALLLLGGTALVWRRQRS